MSIEKIDWKYSLLRAYGYFAFWLWFKKIATKGTENIPKNEPVIFAPNHQNALMDPLAHLFGSMRQTVFLARADIFKKKLIARILTFLKITPVYRMRDGRDQLHKNDEVFDKSIYILSKNMPLALFPEARHNNRRSLLPIQKAVPRIAFMAEEKHNWKLGLNVVPVGIYYSDYFNPDSLLYVEYGKPIKVADFKDDYIENQNKAVVKFKTELHKRLKPLTIDIQNHNYYNTYETVREMYCQSMLNRMDIPKPTIENKFKADQKTIELLDSLHENKPETFAKIHKNSEEYSAFLSKYKLTDKLIRKGKVSIIGQLLQWLVIIAFSPVFLYGWLVNLLPYGFPLRFIKKNVKDPQFNSSIRWGMGMIMFPIYYFILTGIASIFTEHWWQTWFFFASMPFAGFWAYRYSTLFKTLKMKWRFFRLKSAKNSEVPTLTQLRQSVINQLNDETIMEPKVG